MGFWIDALNNNQFRVGGAGKNNQTFYNIDAALGYLKKEFKPFIEAHEEGKKEECKQGSLIIKTEKIVIRGVKKRKITSIDGLIVHGGLPIKYLENVPYINQYYNANYDVTPFVKFKTKKGTIVERCFEVGREYDPVEWDDEILPAIREAGERLHNIRKEVKEAEKTWCGEETFII